MCADVAGQASSTASSLSAPENELSPMERPGFSSEQPASQAPANQIVSFASEAIATPVAGLTKLTKLAAIGSAGATQAGAKACAEHALASKLHLVHSQTADLSASAATEDVTDRLLITSAVTSNTLSSSNSTAANGAASGARPALVSAISISPWTIPDGVDVEPAVSTAALSLPVSVSASPASIPVSTDVVAPVVVAPAAAPVAAFVAATAPATLAAAPTIGDMVNGEGTGEHAPATAPVPTAPTLEDAATILRHHSMLSFHLQL